MSALAVRAGVGADIVYDQSRRAGLPPEPANDFVRKHPNMRGSHQSSPLQRPQHGEGSDEMKSAPSAGNFSGSYDDRHARRTRLQESFALHVTDPAKIVARKVNASADTVETHRQAVPKSWTSMIEYCRAYPAFALDVVEAMGLDLDRDRESYAIFLALQRQMRGE